MNTWQTYHAENAYLGGTVDIAWLEVFREVAARGSLTAAAQALGYTQPAVSRQVAALEKATGARLFDRLPRGVRLTEEGRFLLTHADVVLERMRAAADGLQALRNLEAGRLRAGAIDSANAALLPRALAAFRTVHPGVRLSVAEGGHTGPARPTPQRGDRRRRDQQQPGPGAGGRPVRPVSPDR